VARAARRRVSGDERCDLVTTEFRAEPWEAYVPSETRDASVARRLVRQIGAIHHAGFVHWDLFLKKVLFSRAIVCRRDRL